MHLHKDQPTPHPEPRIRRTMDKQNRPSTGTLLPRARHSRPPRAGQLFHTGHGFNHIPDQPSGTTEHPADAARVFSARARGLGRSE